MYFPLVKTIVSIRPGISIELSSRYSWFCPHRQRAFDTLLGEPVNIHYTTMHSFNCFL